MPELPEVNTFKIFFDKHSLKKQIAKVKVSDDKIIRNMTGRRFAQKLEGRTFKASVRRGKYLFGKLDNGHHVLLHFGMTGDLKFYLDKSDISKHERFRFEFEDGSFLGFDCPRKFARILYLDDLEEYLSSSKLGPDALKISLKAFLDKAADKKVSIKGFLLNQHILAGVGNLYADAICYNKRIHPASRTGALTKKQLKSIHTEMQNILNEAVHRLAHYKSYPGSWYWDWRVEGSKPKKKYGLVKVTKVAGRTTYFCEGWQILYL